MPPLLPLVPTPDGQMPFPDQVPSHSEGHLTLIPRPTRQGLFLCVSSLRRQAGLRLGWPFFCCLKMGSYSCFKAFACCFPLLGCPFPGNLLTVSSFLTTSSFRIQVSLSPAFSHQSLRPSQAGIQALPHSFSLPLPKAPAVSFVHPEILST